MKIKQLLKILLIGLVNAFGLFIAKSYIGGMKGTPTAFLVAGFVFGLVNRIFHIWIESMEHKILFCLFFGIFYLALYTAALYVVLDQMPGIYFNIDRIGQIALAAIILLIINIIANRVIDEVMGE